MSIERTLERIADALEKSAEMSEKMANPTQILTAARAQQLESMSAASEAVIAAAVATPFPEASAPAKRGRPAKPAPEMPSGETTTARVVTRDDVTNTLREYVRVKGKEGEAKAKSILLEFGAGRISEIDAKHYAALQDKLSADLK